jgi:hypothetical protein
MVEVPERARASAADAHPLRVDVARAFARVVAASDPLAAALVEAEADRLERDDPDARAAEAEALDGPAGRAGQLVFEALRRGNLLVAPDVGDPDRAHLWACDDDACAIDDRRARRHGAAAHAVDLLRELGARVAPGDDARLASLSLLLFGPIEPVIGALAERGLAPTVTSLSLRASPGLRVPRLDPALPSLGALSASWPEAREALAGGHPSLAAIAIGALDVPVREVVRALDRMALPALSSLALPGIVDEADLDALARSRLVRRLSFLDLATTHDAALFPFDALAARRARFDHLAGLALGGHLVPPRARRAFASWPAVRFASWDRRELLAFDLATTGWPAGLR